MVCAIFIIYVKTNTFICGTYQVWESSYVVQKEQLRHFEYFPVPSQILNMIRKSALTLHYNYSEDETRSEVLYLYTREYKIGLSWETWHMRQCIRQYYFRCNNIKIGMLINECYICSLTYIRSTHILVDQFPQDSEYTVAFPFVAMSIDSDSSSWTIFQYIHKWRTHVKIFPVFFINQNF